MADEQGYGLPTGAGDTAKRKVEEANQRVRTAEVGTVRTDVAVSSLRVILAEAKSLHMENGYVPKLRRIFRNVPTEGDAHVA